VKNVHIHILGVLIGFVLGLLVNWLICNSQLCRSGALFKTGKSRSLRLTKLSANNTYSPEVETLWNDFNDYTTKELNWIQNFHLSKWRFKFINYLKKKLLQLPQSETFIL